MVALTGAQKGALAGAEESVGSEEPMIARETTQGWDWPVGVVFHQQKILPSVSSQQREGNNTKAERDLEVYMCWREYQDPVLGLQVRSQFLKSGRRAFYILTEKEINCVDAKPGGFVTRGAEGAIYSGYP